MTYVNFSRPIVTHFIFIILLLFSCKKDSDNNPSSKFIGTYTGDSITIKNDLAIDSQNNAFITFGKGANNNELSITASSLNIVQNTITLSGNNLILPRRAIPGNSTYEEGRGKFDGNTLLFVYNQTSEQSDNGQISKIEIKIQCNLKKI